MNSNHQARVIDDPATARLLTSSAQRLALAPFLCGPCSVAGAAERLGWKRAQMDYRVSEMRRLGLLEQVGRHQTGRHVTRLYQATAQAFVIPFALTAHATLSELLSALDLVERFTHHAAAALGESADEWGVMLSTDAGGRVVTTLTPLTGVRPLTVQAVLGSSSPALWRSDELLSLSHQQAKVLQQELAELVGRYRPFACVEEEATHFLMLGLTPKSS